MKVKALKSFCGIISMTEGEVRVISDLNLVKDLMDAGLIAKAEDKPKRTKRSAKK